MASHHPNPRETAISFARRMAGSPAFAALFREGMDLVEDAAAYLDGNGRIDARGLSRTDAVVYAAESMRLTTRLMQIASWLLLQRAVNDGELSNDEAGTDRHRVRLTCQDMVAAPEARCRLPARLVELVTQSVRLQARIQHLDALMYDAAEPMLAPVGPQAPPDVHAQLARLRAAFGAR